MDTCSCLQKMFMISGKTNKQKPNHLTVWGISSLLHMSMILKTEKKENLKDRPRIQTKIDTETQIWDMGPQNREWWMTAGSLGVTRTKAFCVGEGWTQSRALHSASPKATEAASKPSQEPWLRWSHMNQEPGFRQPRWLSLTGHSFDAFRIRLDVVSSRVFILASFPSVMTEGWSLPHSSANPPPALQSHLRQLFMRPHQGIFLFCIFNFWAFTISFTWIFKHSADHHPKEILSHLRVSLYH